METELSLALQAIAMRGSFNADSAAVPEFMSGDVPRAEELGLRGDSLNQRNTVASKHRSYFINLISMYYEKVFCDSYCCS